MQYRNIRRPLSMAGILGVAGLLAACANGPEEQAYNVPPPAPAGSHVVPPEYSGSSSPEQLSVTTPGYSSQIGGFATTADLHLRAGPGVGAPVVATLPRGTPVQRNGMVEGNWWGVRTPDGTGWVYSRYLAPT